MITKLRLKELIEYKAMPGSQTLSLYLSVDQSDAANLNRMFEVSLFNVLREVEEALDSRKLRDFRADAIRIQDFVEGYRPQAKGLIIFCDSSVRLEVDYARQASSSQPGLMGRKRLLVHAKSTSGL